MELKDITSQELVEILIERTRKLKSIDEYNPKYSKDLLDEVEEIFLEIKNRNTLKIKETGRVDKWV